MPDGTFSDTVPRLGMAQEFVTALTGSSDSVIRLRFIHDKDRTQPSVEREGPLALHWPDVLDFQRRGYGIFYFVNEIKPGPGSGWQGMAKDEDVERVRVLGADFDGGLPDDWEFHVAPHLIVRTSTKDGVQRGQALWRVSDCPVADFKVLQQRLAAHYGTDPQVCNFSRVFRLPGTLHQKRDPSSLVMFSAIRSDRPATIQTLMRDIPALSADHKPRAEGDGADSPHVGTDRAISRAHLRDILRHIDPAGDRGPWRDIIAAVRATPVADDPTNDDKLGIAMEWSARWGGWDEAAEIELRKIWQTMQPKDKGVGYGTIYHRAKEGGYTGRPAQEPASAAFADYIAGLGAGGSEDEFDPAGDEQGRGEQRNPRLAFKNESDVFDMPDPTELIGGMLMERENVCFVGPPKVGKTFLGIEIGYSLASGRSLIGGAPVLRNGPVVYLSGEGHGGFKRRLKAWRQARGIPADQSLPFVYNSFVPLASGGAQEIRDFVAGIREHLGGVNPVLVVIDTLARSMSGLNENDAGDANKYLDLAEGLRAGLGCTTLTLAHSVKDPKAAIDIRGSGAFIGGFDAIWTVEMNEQNATLKLEAKWLKEADDLGPFCFRLRSVEVEGMEHGKGAVLDHATIAEFKGKNKLDNRTAHRWILYQQLDTLNIRAPAYPLPVDEVAALIVETINEHPEPRNSKDQAAHDAWDTEVKKVEKQLRNGSRGGRPRADGSSGSPLYSGFFAESVRGGSALQLLWRLPARDSLEDQKLKAEWDAPQSEGGE